MPKRTSHSSDWEPFASEQGLVRLVLLVDWDPIGIVTHTEAWDEYDSYVEGVYQLLKSGADAETVAAHLWHIETVLMKVRGNHDTTEAVARKLVEFMRWFEIEKQRHQRFLDEEKREKG